MGRPRRASDLGSFFDLGELDISGRLLVLHDPVSQEFPPETVFWRDNKMDTDVVMPVVGTPKIIRYAQERYRDHF